MHLLVHTCYLRLSFSTKREVLTRNVPIIFCDKYIEDDGLNKFAGIWCSKVKFLMGRGALGCLIYFDEENKNVHFGKNVGVL